MSTVLRVAKDPNDIDDITWDWSNRLATGETISTFTATVAAGGVTVESESTSGATTTARLSGGTAGVSAQITGRIVTSLGRQLDWTIELPVSEQ